MLRVKTKLVASGIHGVGLFAAEFIPKGTITWQYDPEFDTAFEQSAIERIPEHVRSQFMKYSYYDHDLKKYVLCSDDQRFINHSDNPNIVSTPQRDEALIDIHLGEELLCDYAHYEHDWFERRGIKREDFIS
jgi:SET domain-containing protein